MYLYIHLDHTVTGQSRSQSYVTTDEGNGPNDVNTEQRDEIGVAVQSWL